MHESAAFRHALTHWRNLRGLSKKQLAIRMGFDPSYVSHVESGRHRPTEDFARRAEFALEADNEIWRGWLAYRSAQAGQPVRPAAQQRAPDHGDLVIDRELARLTYVDDHYDVEVARRLRNVGTEPVVRYPVRLGGEPVDGLRAHCDDEPLTWRTDGDHDVWLEFANAGRRFPLNPGQTTELRYRRRTGCDRSFERTVRLPTGRLDVELLLPAGREPVVWGTHTSLTSDGALPTPIGRDDDGPTATFRWTAGTPALLARYRLEWRFTA